MTTVGHEPPRARAHPMRRYEYKVIDTGKHVEDQLNELGAPFYHNEHEAVLGVERFVAKYPEIERVTWYRPDGAAMLSLGKTGVERAPSVPLTDEMRVAIAARAGADPAYLLTESAEANRFRLSGPILTEAFAGDGLFGFDPNAPQTSGPREKSWPGYW